VSVWVKSQCLSIALIFCAFLALRSMEPTKQTIHDELMQAIGKRDHEGVKKALEQGADPNYRKTKTEREGTPLHTAILGPSWSFTIVRELLRWGANPHARSHTGMPAIHIIAGFGECTHMFRELVDQGADLTIRDILGKTPLQFINWCIRESSKVRLYYDDELRLKSIKGIILKTLQDRREREELILQEQANIPLFLHILPEDLRQELLRFVRGPFIYQRALYTRNLIKAVLEGNVAAAQQASWEGADPEVLADDGVPLIAHAATQEDPKQAEELVETLIYYMADPNPVVNAQGDTLLDILSSQKDRQGIIELINDVIKARQQLNPLPTIRLALEQALDGAGLIARAVQGGLRGKHDEYN
jgi:hypothetical protein